MARQSTKYFYWSVLISAALSILFIGVLTVSIIYKWDTGIGAGGVFAAGSTMFLLATLFPNKAPRPRIPHHVDF